MRLVASHGSSACCPLSWELSVNDAQPDGCDVGVCGLSPARDVINGLLIDPVDSYFAAVATPLLVTALSPQAVPTSAASLSQGFPRGVRFLGNPSRNCYPPDGCSLVGRNSTWLLRSHRPFRGRGRCLCCSPRPRRVASETAGLLTPGAWGRFVSGLSTRVGRVRVTTIQTQSSCSYTFLPERDGIGAVGFRLSAV